MTRGVAIIFLVTLGLAQVAGRQSDPIDIIVRDEMESQRIPGMAVAVIRRGEVIRAQGYGLANVEHNAPVTDRTIFQSGSLGKQFTATAVMLQVQDGKLSLSDPIGKYLQRSETWRAITVRHLLNHTSGIPDYNDGQLDYRKDYTEDELVKFAATCRSTSRPAPSGSTATPATSCSARWSAGCPEPSTATCCATRCSHRSA